jgi:hypothetical protein
MTNLADPHGGRIATTEVRLEGFHWAEIAYWERG